MADLRCVPYCVPKPGLSDKTYPMGTAMAEPPTSSDQHPGCHPAPSGEPIEQRADHAEQPTIDQLRPQVLLIEGDHPTAESIAAVLSDRFGGESVTTCETVSHAAEVDLSGIDLVLMGLNTPDGDGAHLLDQLLEKRPDLPVVLMTTQGVLENAVQAIRRGAYDYVIKSGEYLATLPLIVEKNLEVWRIKQENLRLQDQLARTLDEVKIKNDQLEEAVEQLRAVALTDPLTGLDNRRSLSQALDRCFAEASRYGHDLVCLMIDLDNFKPLNDTLGHQSGDQVLQRTARVLEANSRRADVAGRYGGDEFMIILPQTNRVTALRVAQRIRKQFQTAMTAIQGEFAMPGTVTMSMGLATLHQSRPASPEQLITHADHALYQAKEAGKNAIKVYVRSPGKVPLSN